jgi:hypothetical protein
VALIAAGSADTINFADQQGIYILHKDRSAAYVGRTTDSRYERLRSHHRDRKSVRWGKFSWFGFRDTDGQSDELKPIPNALASVSPHQHPGSALIEALEPPVNGRRGNLLGLQCEQAPDPDTAMRQSREFLRGLIG